MKETFKVWETNRKIYLKFLEGYSNEQLHIIPEGLNNNLFWNIAHVVVVQQALVYKLAGLPMMISNELFEKYRNGSKPTLSTPQEEIDLIKNILKESVTKTKEDYEKGMFSTYTEYTTSTGFNLASVEDAITFNNYHEGTHLGFMLKIKKFL